MQRGSPYRVELRERVIKLWQAGRRWEELTELFQIGRATVNRWVRRYVTDQRHRDDGGRRLCRADDLAERALGAGVVERQVAVVEDAAQLGFLVERVSKRLGGEVAAGRGIARGACPAEEVYALHE